MKRLLILLVLCTSSFIAVGNVKADPLLLYTLSGTLSADAGDAAGLNGASFTLSALYDNLNGRYVERFGFAAIPALSAEVRISGAPNGQNNGSWAFDTDLAFYPTFAGTFTEPTGLQPEFFVGSGFQMQFIGNTDPSPGSANVVIGGQVELDDFAPATYSNGINNLQTGDSYTLANARIEAIKTVPEPASASLLAIGLIGALLRRRRVA